MWDAVVVGAGPNGLVAANVLAAAGWSVLVLEAEPEPGGAVRSAEMSPGHVYDRFSAFYPLGVASPAMRRMDLERHGVRWRRAAIALAHPFADGSCAAISSDPTVTAESVDRFSPGDGAAWLDLLELWRKVGGPLLDAVTGVPFPPVWPTARLAARLGARGAARLARLALLPVRRLAEETFGGTGATMLLAGNALHSDLAPEAPLSGLFGWILASLGQTVGFPVPEGGSGNLTRALVSRLRALGGTVVCGAPVERIVVRDGRARGVVVTGGERAEARRAVLADVDAPTLFLRLVGAGHLPAGMARDMARFQYDNATVKVDWAVRSPIPWTAAPARRAGTIHVARDLDHLTEASAQLAMGFVPARPFLVMGQMTTADPTRSPAGVEMLWAYTHVPQRIRGDAGGDVTGRWDAKDADLFVARMEDEIEALAPGFRERVLRRVIATPRDLEASDGNLVNGAVNGGTSALHQQLLFRPIPGLGRPQTPIRGLYLASASAHPGGGVHGACGANAARAALTRRRAMRTVVTVAAAGGLALAGKKVVR